MRQPPHRSVLSQDGHRDRYRRTRLAPSQRQPHGAHSCRPTVSAFRVLALNKALQIRLSPRFVGDLRQRGNRQFHQPTKRGILLCQGFPNLSHRFLAKVRRRLEEIGPLLDDRVWQGSGCVIGTVDGLDVLTSYLVTVFEPSPVMSARFPCRTIGMRRTHFFPNRSRTAIPTRMMRSIGSP